MNIKNLGLNLNEGPHISLVDLNIDWDRFNLNCVQYYKKWSHLSAKTVNLKSYDQSLPIENQVLSQFTDWATRINSNDIFLRIAQYIKNVANGLKKGQNTLNVASYFNTDLETEFPYIVETIQSIENFANIKFNRVKLLYLKPFDLEPIHTDMGGVRYHLPIVTNDNVFFCEGDSFFNMLEFGKLYLLNTKNPHTVVNASGSLGRLHLVAHPQDEETDVETLETQKRFVSQIEETHKKYLQYADDYIKNAKPADLTLNSDVYKQVKLEILKFKKLQNV
jgi:hypothetical protein